MFKLHQSFLSPKLINRLVPAAGILALSLMACTHLEVAVTACPNLELKESTFDCPWAQIARNISEKTGLQGSSDTLRDRLIEEEINRLSPALAVSIQQDMGNEAWKESWGLSQNFDDLARAQIVNPDILNYFYRQLSVNGPSELQKAANPHVQHAGIEHTYGYLLSLLQTPYGFKRARWVSGEIEHGFNLPIGILGPTPSTGSFLKNVTFFIGQFGFDGDALNERERLETLAAPNHPLRSLNRRSLKRERLVESLTEPIPMQIRTDIVWFSQIPKNLRDENSALLIYSIKIEKRRAQIITAFPVKSAFIDGLHRPEFLGEQQPTALRYNAVVPEVPIGSKLTGRRVWLTLQP